MDLSLAVSLVSALVSVVLLVVSTRQHLWAKSLDRAMEATDAVVDAIQDLREAVWAAARQTPNPEVIAERIYRVDRECRHYASVLPGLGAVRHSVREAAGNYFGGAGGYAVSPQLKDVPVSAHDPYWWDISLTYLDYVVHQLSRGKWSSKRRNATLIPFDQWRRDEDEGHHVPLSVLTAQLPD